MCEIGLGKADTHKCLERFSNSLLALESIVRTGKHGFRFSGAPPFQQKPPELDLGVAGPARIAAAIERGNRFAQRPLRSGMPTSLRQSLDFGHQPAHPSVRHP
jgi:hypothetical protein